MVHSIIFFILFFHNRLRVWIHSLTPPPQSICLFLYRPPCSLDTVSTTASSSLSPPMSDRPYNMNHTFVCSYIAGKQPPYKKVFERCMNQSRLFAQHVFAQLKA